MAVCGDNRDSRETLIHAAGPDTYLDPGNLAPVTHSTSPLLSVKAWQTFVEPVPCSTEYRMSGSASIVLGVLIIKVLPVRHLQYVTEPRSRDLQGPDRPAIGISPPSQKGQDETAQYIGHSER